jgi:hypothetical protein
MLTYPLGCLCLRGPFLRLLLASASTPSEALADWPKNRSKKGRNLRCADWRGPGSDRRTIEVLRRRSGWSGALTADNCAVTALVGSPPRTFE